MKLTKVIWSITALTVLCVQAVPLDNWRRPFYTIAAQRGSATSSPSGLFWDALPGGAGCFAPRLWPDSASYAVDHWSFEPSLGIMLDTEPFPTGTNSNLHFGALSDFAFGPLLVRTVLDAEQRYSREEDYYWHQKRGAAGRIQEAYAQYTGSMGFVRFGRLNRSWGPFPDRSILLSDHPFTYDAVEWQLHLPFLEFRHLLAAFPLKHSDVDAGVKYRLNSRYFSAHALNFIFGSWTAVGISETVLFTRNSGFPDLQYLNPVGIYTVSNTNHEGNGNLMLGLQGWAHPFTKKVLLKGQVVFDDFQVDNEVAGDQEPTHWACDVGGYLIDPLPLKLSHHLAVEYRYVSKWMYTVNGDNTLNGERYTYLGRSLGNPWVDGDLLRIAITAVGDDHWAVSTGFEFGRQDTNTLRTPWIRPDTSSWALGYRTETPLGRRSNVATTISIPLKAHAYFRDFAAAHLTVDNQWIQNRDHNQRRGFLYEPHVALTLTVHYSDLFLKLGNKEKHKP